MPHDAITVDKPASPRVHVWWWRRGGVRIVETARDGGQMMDPETKRAWRRLQKEVRDNAPIVLRGLASEGKRVSRQLFSAIVRGCKSLTRRAKEWNASFGGKKALVSQL